MSEDGLQSTPHVGASLSLLSLSIVAANAEPIEVPQDSAFDADDHHSWRGVSSEATHHGRNPSQGVAIHNGTKHRRLSSTGQVRRRLSDARDAASRPSTVALPSATTTLNSLASISISSSASPQGPDGSSAFYRAPTGPVAIPGTSAHTSRNSISRSVPGDDGTSVSLLMTESKSVVTGGTSRNGKKRGTTFTCESCSKVYRHPSCLIKHRWEHTPHWREASKFLLSKHQQVQLMEAAAILSHLTPSASGGSSLPDDRSLWPSFLSGGALPPPVPVPLGESVTETTAYPTSSSVPSGPRIHDYSLPSTSVSGITRLRPGIIAVPTEPVSYGPPENGIAQSYTTGGYGSSFASSYQSLSTGVIVPHAPASGSSDRWSRSFSLSHSGSSDESEFVEVEAETTPSGRFGVHRPHLDMEGDVSVKEEEEEESGWDGMEMEMEL